ncbi:universal stress protein [Halopseudomonas pelagia]|uniref:universal stress protein n=1 Tax=Halopseudomonas pelagia TaxID=553151 RepID=UPI00039BD356|nr:universal stress protein [Halopseudomonas pelagia]|tara:strand:- start:15059 stop:15991 length:933 start_codon:yes stop_codon:yes gene_type:complete
MNIQHMLVVIDPTTEDAQPCLQRAEELAARWPQAHITLFICEYNSALDGGIFTNDAGLQKARASLIEHRRQNLERMAQPLRDKGLAVSVEAVWGKRLTRHILAAVSTHKPDLVLKTTHYHNRLKRLLLSNSDWDLIRHCEVPVWLVKKAGERLARLAISVDPLHEADKPAALDLKLIACGRSLAAPLEAELHLVHCYNPLPRTLVFDASIISDYDSYAGDIRKRHADAFESLAGSNDIADSARHLLQGYPEEAIPDFVEQRNINLLVMGAVSRSRLDSALLGHTAERLLDDCACDILVVKPDGFVDPSKP